MLLGKTPIPGAKSALDLLNRQQIPWIILTNGGGQSEQARAKQVSGLINVEISESQIVQSHTPFQALADKYHRVLVVGGEGDNCRHVAEQVYGFKDVVIPADIVKENPSASPFKGYTDETIDKIGRVRHFHELGSTNSKVDAILVFNDSRDMTTDLQIIMDLLLSDRGHIGTRRNLKACNKDGTEQDLSIPSIPIYFCCDDFLWKNNYPLTRLGAGSFRLIIEQIYARLTKGAKLQSTLCGKPFKTTYEYAERALQEWRTKKFGATNSIKDTTVFMVGDNPASDVVGANGFGWHSILVKTGVYKDKDFSSLVAIPNQIENDAEKAVEYGINYGRAIS